MIIEATNLSKRFARHDAVHDVSLSVPPGAAYALIGANGAGKTTTLKMLVNVLAPDSGRATIMGTDSRRLSHREFQRIGFLSENHKLPERLTVEQYFAYWRVFYTSWDRALEKDLRKRLDLPADRRLDKLSHGMRVKTMLAGALAFRPTLLILDEPLSGLDPLVRDEVLDGLLRQADETTIVISSHELTEIESFTTHVAFMDRGRVVFEESTDILASRFREVSVTLPRGREAAAHALPAGWLAPEVSGQVIRFVDTGFVDQDELGRRLASLLGRVEGFEALPLSLRDISKALMRASREGARS
jgi:ABC-2 type transport system ATP-binding protein